jgi:hypothetical protein
VYSFSVGPLDRNATGEEVVVALPVPRERVRFPKSVRSTLIASSLRSIRERGRFDDYRRHLEAPWREIPEVAIAGAWLPLDAGLAHYRACDALGFTLAEQHDIGREVGDRIHGTFLGSMIRGAKNVGVTPWIVLAQARKLYERLYDGGAVSVIRVGPKDARMEMVGNPSVDIPYFRHAMRGLWQVAVEFFCTKAYVNETGRGPAFYKVRIAWA